MRPSLVTARCAIAAVGLVAVSSPGASSDDSFEASGFHSPLHASQTERRAPAIGAPTPGMVVSNPRPPALERTRARRIARAVIAPEAIENEASIAGLSSGS